MTVPQHESAETLLRKPHYTLEELAELIAMSVYVVREGARRGELKAIIVDHRVVTVRRHYAIDWLHRLTV